MKKGDCYEISAKLILGDFWTDRRKRPNLSSSARLVHGMVAGQGQLEGFRYGHAWVEDGSTVYDYSNGREIKMPKQAYYALGKIKDRGKYEYSEQEVRGKILDTEHWGPWEANGGVEPMREVTADVKAEVGTPGMKVPSQILMQMKESTSIREDIEEYDITPEEITARIL